MTLADSDGDTASGASENEEEDPVQKAARLAEERSNAQSTPQPVTTGRRQMMTQRTAMAAQPRAALVPEPTKKAPGKKSSAGTAEKPLTVSDDDTEPRRRSKRKHKTRSRSSSSSSESSSEDERSRKKRSKKSKKKKSKKSKKSRRRSSSRSDGEESSDEETESMTVTFSDPAKVSWNERKGELTLEDDGMSNVLMEARHKLRVPNADPSLWWKKPFSSEKSTPVRGAGLYLEAAMGVARVNELTLKRLHFRSNAVTVKMLLTRNADVNLKDSKVNYSNTT